MIKFLILLLAFYFLAIFQVSFFSHFEIGGTLANLLLILVLILILFAKSRDLALSGAFLAGLFFDFFSETFFGFYLLIFLILALFLRKIHQFFYQIDFLNFEILLFLAIIFFHFLSVLMGVIVYQIEFFWPSPWLISYNLTLGGIIFLGSKYVLSTLKRI